MPANAKLRGNPYIEASDMLAQGLGLPGGAGVTVGGMLKVQLVAGAAADTNIPVTGINPEDHVMSIMQYGDQEYTPTLSPAIVAANTTAEQIFAVVGVGATDKVVSVSKPTAQAGLGIVGWRVSSAGNIAITFSNNTAAGITPTAAEVYTVRVAPPLAGHDHSADISVISAGNIQLAVATLAKKLRVLWLDAK